MQAPLLAYTHFVEALFVLNGCSAGAHRMRPASEGVRALSHWLFSHLHQARVSSAQSCVHEVRR